MSLPEKIEFRLVSIVDDYKGFREERFRNNDFGIEMFKCRASQMAPWKSKYTVDQLPGLEFPDYESLRTAVNRG